MRNTTSLSIARNGYRKSGVKRDLDDKIRLCVNLVFDSVSPV